MARRRILFDHEFAICSLSWPKSQLRADWAKSEGKALGRPSTLSDKQKQDVHDDLAKGMSISAIARKFATSRQTIMRVRYESSRAT